MNQIVIFSALLCAVSSIAHAETVEKIDEVVVTATRIVQPLKSSLSHTTVITQQDIQEAQAVDVPALLKGLAGVEIYQSGGIGKQSSLFMRGTNSSHTLVLLDGVRINSATTGTTALDQIMLDQIERIEVVRGNVSSVYGSEAIGGVIQIFTKRGKGEPAFSASGGVGSNRTHNASVALGGESGNTSFNLQASRFGTDGVTAIKPSLVATVNPDADGYQNSSLSANVRQVVNADHSVSASAFQSDGNVQYDDAWKAATDSNLFTSLLQKTSLALDSRLNKSWTSKIQWAQGSDDYKDYFNGARSSAIKTTNNQLAWQNTLMLDAIDSLLFGVERLDQHVTSTTVYSKIDRQVGSALAGYTGNAGIHQVQLNLRHDSYSDFGAANTGLFGYGLAMNDFWRATASISTAYKAPTFTDLYAPTSWGSNSMLNPERSNNKEIGLRYADKVRQLNVVYFDNRITDLIATDAMWKLQNINLARIDGVKTLVMKKRTWPCCVARSFSGMSA